MQPDPHVVYQNETIVAIATPPGRGGIGIVRLSGSEAIRIAELLTHANLRFQLGNQVGELGILGAAARQFLAALSGVASFEGGGAGQLAAEQVTRPDLSLPAALYVGSETLGEGLGVELVTDVVEKWSRRVLRYEGANAWHAHPGRLGCTGSAEDLEGATKESRAGT